MCRASMTIAGDLPPARLGEPEQRLFCAPAIGNDGGARANKRGECRAIRRGSCPDVREGEQG